MAVVENLHEELAYFEEIRPELLKAYEGQFVLIKGKKKLGVFPSMEQAYRAGIKEVGNVPFLIKEIQKTDTVHQQPALNNSLLNAGI